MRSKIGYLRLLLDVGMSYSALCQSDSVTYEDHDGGAENAGVEKAGVENAGATTYGNVWKAVKKKSIRLVGLFYVHY